MVLGKLDSNMQNYKIGPLSYTMHKINSKWIKDLNVNLETIKSLEENTSNNLFDFGWSDLSGWIKVVKILKNQAEFDLKTFFILLLFLKFIYFEREKAQAGKGQREGDTESEAVSRLWAVSTEPYMGLKPTNSEIMTWAKAGCWTYWATQAPLEDIF